MRPATCLSLATRIRVAASLNPYPLRDRKRVDALLLYFQRGFQRDALCDRSPGSPFAPHGRQGEILLIRTKRGDETVVGNHRGAEVIHVHGPARSKTADVVVATSHVAERGIKSEEHT